MPSYETSVDVAAPPPVVWSATCDIESWPRWSPTMDAITRQDSGPIAPGSSAQVEQPGLRPATWVVDEATPDRSFVWHTGGPGYRILADHRIEPRAGDGSVVRLSVTMSGPLSPLLWALTGRTVRRYLDQEAAGLRAHCEGL